MALKSLVAALVVCLSGMTAIGAAIAMSAPPTDDKSLTRDRYKCFDPDMISNFMTIDHNRMVVVTYRDQAYELRLAGMCSNIDTAFQVGIRSRHGLDVCSGFDASILYSDMGQVQECVVTDVRHLSPEDAAPYVDGRGGHRQEQR